MKNYKTFLALLLAIMLPLVSYYLVKKYSTEAVHMPQRYFYDSVGTKQVRGTVVSDTSWHKVKDLRMVNQLGHKVSLDDLKGKIILVDFFFTRCPSICPSMTKAMKKLQDSFKKNDSIVQFISISIDPKNDSVKQLKSYSDKYSIDPGSWWLATGDKEAIYNFALKEMKASVADVNVDTAFVHTENFFLLDKEHVVRGWYNGLDSVAQAKLVRDIPILMLEKDRKKTFGDFLKELFGRS